MSIYSLPLLKSKRRFRSRMVRDHFVSEYSQEFLHECYIGNAPCTVALHRKGAIFVTRYLSFVAAVVIIFCSWTFLVQAGAANKPKLILLVVIDQFRYDYLLHFNDQYTGGLNRLLIQGAVFENANLEHYPAVTAIGHATVLTGATPALSGIMGNDWYDRESHKRVTSISDETEKVLGGSGSGASPRRLLVSTIGDELKMVHPESTHVIGISLKDRSAILPGGHMANAAYWYDTKTGNFVSSTYYFPELPAWVKAFDASRPSDKFAGSGWLISEAPSRSKRLPAAPGPELYSAIFGSPYGNELLEAFAEKAIAAENLGQHDSTDLLSVSFSSNDVVGHSFGPDSPEVRDISIRIDRLLEKLFAYLDQRIGMQNVIVVLTSDHGVSPLPENLTKWNMPGGRMTTADLFGPIKSALDAKFGKGEWILDTAGTSPYLNLDLIREKGLDEAEVRRVAAKAAAAVPHVLRVYTGDQLQLGAVPNDPISTRVIRSFNSKRSGDLEILLEPYWIRSAEGTTHGTPYSYDTHVPLVFMGPWVRPGHYFQNVALNDIAPTLATILGVETPNGSAGKVLYDIIQQRVDGETPARRQP
jgi:predicted AlkP superfamily pyrophosphatase or phosphodiesterase